MKVLVISYTFPPNPGIGGRRWVKFSKYLFKKGVELKIISASFNRTKDSEWKKDLVGIEDFISYLNPGMVKHLANVPQSLYEKLMYKLALIYIKIYSKGNFYDRSLFWVNEVVRSLRQELATGEVECVIATGSPFKYLYDVALLKQVYPNVKFIADLRDPWTHTDSNGWDRLAPERQVQELKFEKYVVENFDLIIAVTPGIIDILKKRYSNVNSLALIENGYDIDDLMDQPNLKPKSGIIRMIFAGTFYPNAYEYLVVFVNGLKSYLTTQEDAGIVFEIDFYGATDSEFHAITKTVSCIRHHGNISLPEVHEKLQLSDYGLLFLSKEINYSISTKFCEYVLYNRPLIVFGPFGYTKNFIESNDLGWAIQDEKSWIILLKELERLKVNNESKIISRDAISHLNIEKITDRLINEINVIKVV